MNTLEISRPAPTLTDQLNYSDVSKEQWHELSGCGFSINSQIRMMKQLYYQDAEFGSSTQESLQAWVKESNLDIKGFIFEYLQRGLVLPNPVDFKEINGEVRVAGKNSERPLLESISSQERFGTVKNTFREMEKVLQNAKPGSMVVMTSPDGWSGLKNDEGEDIIFSDSQTIAMRKNEQGKLESFTFVTDMNFDQNKALLQNFGVGEDKFISSWDQQQRLADITSKAVFLDGNDKNNQFEDVVDALKKAKNSPFARGGQHFDVMYGRLKDKDSLTTLSEDAEALISDFENFVLGLPPKLRSEHFEMVGEKLAKTILQLSSLIRGGKSLDQVKNMGDGDYSQEHKRVAVIPGCAGGGYSSTPFGGRRTEGGECVEIQCRYCKWKPNSEQLKQIETRTLDRCPDCKRKP
jgi:hypothetical protein